MWIADAYWEREENTEQQSRWDRQITRVGRSSGRMELHVMLVQDGSGARRFIFPQRSDERSFHSGLLVEVLAHPEECDGSKAIQELLAASEGVFKVH